MGAAKGAAGFTVGGLVPQRSDVPLGETQEVQVFLGLVERRGGRGGVGLGAAEVLHGTHPLGHELSLTAQRIVCLPARARGR